MKPAGLTRADFPSDFLFGAATSSYQIEGQAFGGAGKTHWDSFAEIPGAISDGSNGALACDHFHHFESDLDYLRGFDAYRFSVSWARILPQGQGPVNQQGLDFYDRLVDTILARGLKPFLTLYHWDLPAALAERGGWTNPDIALWFADYTDIVLDRIGDRISRVATLNEPWCVAWLSHFLGLHAPGQQDITAAARSMHHVLVAHAQAMERMRARGQENLGIVLNFEQAESLNETPQNQAATARFDAIFNRWFLQAICQGTYPQEALDGLQAHLPLNWQDDLETIRQPIDWLGVNYYTRQILSFDPDAPWPGYQTHQGPLPQTDMGWEIYADGLQQLLNRLTSDYVGDLPIYVTENGLAEADQVKAGTIADPRRWQFIQDHLAAILRARSDGANVQGYFYWSLLDNFEWAYGYDKRFGLIHVDYETQTRTPKASFYRFKEAFARS